MNDPDILAWLDTEEGRLWLDDRHKIAVGGIHFFTIKENIEKYQQEMDWKLGREVVCMGDELIYLDPFDFQRSHP